MQSDASQGFKDRAARSLLNHPVTCTVKGTNEVFEALCANVSQSGMFLSCSSPPPAGSDIAFRFIEQGIVLIQGEARVARVVSANNQLGAGVFFTSLDGPARRLIDRVVALNSNAGAEEVPGAPEDMPSGVKLSLDLD